MVRVRVMAQALERHDVNGTLRGVDARELLDRALGNAADARCLGEGVVLDAVLDGLEHRLVRNALDLERALDGRVGSLRKRGLVARRLVPHHDRIDLGGLAGLRVDGTLCGGDAEIAQAQVRAVLLHQERRHRAALHVRDVHQVVLDDVVGHGQHHGAVGTGGDGHVGVGMRGGSRELRIDGDELRALLARLAHVLPCVHVCLCRVAAPGDDGLGIDCVGEVVALVAEQRGLHVLLRRVGARPEDDRARGRAEAAVRNGHEAAHGAVQRAVGAVGRPEAQRRAAVLGQSGLHLAGDDLERLVPLDALPFARAALSDALQGVLQTVGVVDALRLAEALDAQAAAMRVLARVFHCGNLDGAAFAHGHLQRTAAAAVAATLAPERGFALGRLVRQSLAGLGKTGQGCVGAYHRRRRSGARRLQEAPTRESAMRALRFRHVSSSILDAECLGAHRTKASVLRTAVPFDRTAGAGAPGAFPRFPLISEIGRFPPCHSLPYVTMIINTEV